MGLGVWVGGLWGWEVGLGRVGVWVLGVGVLRVGLGMGLGWGSGWVRAGWGGGIKGWVWGRVVGLGIGWMRIGSLGVESGNCVGRGWEAAGRGIRERAGRDGRVGEGEGGTQIILAA